MIIVIKIIAILTNHSNDTYIYENDDSIITIIIIYIIILY